MFYIKYVQEGGNNMFELPSIIEAVDTTNENDMAGGQYSADMSWTGDCCYGSK